MIVDDQRAIDVDNVSNLPAIWRAKQIASSYTPPGSAIAAISRTIAMTGGL
jgi:hypothetical protein